MFTFLKELIRYVLIITILLELSLRVFPGVIPPQMLKGFHPELRAHIAEKLGLQTKSDLIEQTDRNGATVPIYKPNVDVTLPLHELDAREGGLETMTMDDQGFCNPPNTYDPEVIPVIVTGDSFTWCTAVLPDQTWGVQLADTLGVATYNLGKQNQGLDEEVHIIETLGVPKNPDVVVMAVYEGNDIREAIAYKAQLGKASTTDEVEEKKKEFCALPQALCPAYKAVKDGFLGRYSYTFNLANVSARMAYVGIFNKATGKNVFHERSGALYPDFSYNLQAEDEVVPFNTGQHDRDEPELAYKLQEGIVSLDVFDDALKRFVELSEIHNFEPIVAYIPSAHIAYLDFVSFNDERLHPLLDTFSKSQRDYFARQASTTGYTFVDLTEPLQKLTPQHLTPGNLLYFPINIHLTPVGHQAVAELLTPAIQSALSDE